MYLVFKPETMNKQEITRLNMIERHTQRLPDGSRTVFLVGDGARVGKGRIAAAIIFENFLRGRKNSIWLSVSNEHKHDAKWDLRDIGADQIAFHHLYTSKRSLVSAGDVFGSVKEGVVFSTFSNLTEFSYFLLKLQARLPNARIVYMCATGILEPINMGYMTRLGLWGQGTAFHGGPDKVSEISNRRGRVIQKDNGQMKYEHYFDANFPSKINISEKELFMQGHKNIAIVSEESSRLPFNSFAALTPATKCENCFFGAGLMAIDDTNILKLQRKTSVKEFFEMMLGFPVRLQTSLYKYFTVTEATILAKANMLSECDGINILEWGAGQIVGRKKFNRLKSPYSSAAPLYCARIELHTFEFDQGMSWKLAHDMSASLSGNSEGFYILNLEWNSCHSLGKFLRLSTKRWLQIVRSEELSKNFGIFYTTPSKRTGQCIKKDQGLECKCGLSLKTLNVQCGQIFSAWKEISSVIRSMQAVRVKSRNIQHVGLMIPENSIELVLAILWCKG
ncbi:hypothetical protein DAPPUDRAFT_117092 [Daphnia pulex]|uniref:Strawberry notch AAA domain-containing protein n=1 Tax=Daphnia pulex TaxID=6669 RepID=E9HRI2_DAPPU|nr:hypothetical protein DAPPUDRAFT_117092 [Daphnia pulex]|eukprot:EFX65651.1 hypothetical protein DAPPUDRAFT_117092 [Daphnia pulex]